MGVSLGLVVLTMIAYGDLLWGKKYDFVSFDDYHYVRDNLHVQAGLTGADLWWALTSFEQSNWHPLTWISLQLDSQLFGIQPAWFHRTNLLLHAVNAVLLFLALWWMTEQPWLAAAVAALFAVHPLHVESVAWVTERKDVLSTFFWMLTLLAYIWYAARPDRGRYLLVLVSLTLGLMSKSMLVTLPCVLLLLDWWPLRRWRPDSARRLLLEKVPLLLLAAGCSLLTIAAQKRMMASEHALGPRVLNALVSYVDYLRQMFWPSDLAVLYLHPGTSLSLLQGLTAALVLAGVTLVALLERHRRPYLLVGWLWYLGTLVPVIGVLQVGLQARADRYTYVPLIGIFIALVWGPAEWLGTWRFGRVVFAGGMAALLIACTVVTGSQLKHWQDSTRLWDRALHVSGDDPRLHIIVAEVYLRDGEPDRAIHHAEEARSRQPDNWESHRVLAVALSRQGKIDEAVQSMRRAVALRPDSVDARNQMARLLWLQGNIPAAYEELAVVAQLRPDTREGQNYLGRDLERKGKLDEAIRCFQEAVRLAPDSPLYRIDLAYALEQQGNILAASEEYREALRLHPAWPEEINRLARILATHPDRLRRDGTEAIRRARQVCFVTENAYAPYLETLAAAYAEAGLFEQAASTAGLATALAEKVGNQSLAKRLSAAVQRYQNKQPSREGK
jgi:Flp pilus assembly protein TadD